MQIQDYSELPIDTEAEVRVSRQGAKFAKGRRVRKFVLVLLLVLVIEQTASITITASLSTKRRFSARRAV